MDLSWLDDFLAVADGGGFSRAANRRNITQPALSRHIRALEDWLGAALFERDTHTVVLTPAGNAFRPVVEELLRRLAVGRMEALEVAQMQAETIRFAATHALSQAFFPGWIRKLDGYAPAATVQLVAANMAGCEKLLIDGQVHFLLAHHNPLVATRLDNEHFQKAPLGEDVLLPISAPWALDDLRPRHTLPGAQETPVPYLAYHAGSGIGRIVATTLAGREPVCWLEASFSAPVMLLIDMARDGCGVT